MPKEYIEREALFRAIENIPDNELLGTDNTTFVELPTVLDIISEQPTADVQEVRHGKWIPIKGRFFSSTDDRGGNVVKCSVCGEPSSCGFSTPYCSICGAKMDEE